MFKRQLQSYFSLKLIIYYQMILSFPVNFFKWCYFQEHNKRVLIYFYYDWDTLLDSLIFVNITLKFFRILVCYSKVAIIYRWISDYRNNFWFDLTYLFMLCINIYMRYHFIGLDVSFISRGSYSCDAIYLYSSVTCGEMRQLMIWEICILVLPWNCNLYIYQIVMFIYSPQICVRSTSVQENI